MRKFLIDQTQLLIPHIFIGVALLLGAWFSDDFRVELIMLTSGVVVIFSMCIRCKYLLLLPLDMLIGKKTDVVYFSKVCGGINLEFNKELICPEWCFYCCADKKMQLLLPVSLPKDKLKAMIIPAKDQKLSITYYKLSGLLCYWGPF